jgi:RNA polymerase sigma-70 factor, ECF subfamily
VETLTKHSSDELLIALLRSRDSNAVTLLYEKYSSALYGMIVRIVRIRELAEEVLQDVFVKAWRNFDSYDATKGRLYTWLINIARYAAIDATRSSAFNRPNHQPIDSLLSIVDTRQRALLNTDIIGVEQLTKILPPDLKTLIDLLYFEGYTQAEAAEYLGIPVGTVKTRVRAAIKLLRALF